MEYDKIETFRERFRRNSRWRDVCQVSTRDISYYITLADIN